MIAVIFEVWPADGRKQTYLDIAAGLRPELEQIDGFLSIERFQSLADEPSSCRSPSGATRPPWRRGATSSITVSPEGRSQRRVPRLSPAVAPVLRDTA